MSENVLEEEDEKDPPYEPWLESWSGYACEDNDRSRAFANQAPDMCRALLAVEWRARKFQARPFPYTCPSCGWATDYADRRDHNKGCAIDAALTASGLPNQASRDEARAKIKGMGL